MKEYLRAVWPVPFAFLGILAIGFMGLLGTQLSGDHDETGQHHQRAYSEAYQATSPTPVKHFAEAHPNDAKADAANDNANGSNRTLFGLDATEWTAFFTFALTVTTVGLILLGNRQAAAAEAAVTVANDALTEQLRPWIGFEATQLGFYTAGTGQMAVELVMRNGGGSPAIVSEAIAYPEVLPFDFSTDDLVFAPPEQPSDPGMALPGVLFRLPRAIFDLDDVVEAADRRVKLCVHFSVVYRGTRSEEIFTTSGAFTADIRITGADFRRCYANNADTLVHLINFMQSRIYEVS